MTKTNLNFDNPVLRHGPDGSFRDLLAEIVSFPLQTEWFNEFTIFSQKAYVHYGAVFIDWLYKEKVDEDSKFEVLNLFQEYRVNVIGVKTGNTNTSLIKSLFKQYLIDKNNIDKETFNLCNLIIQRHRPLPKHKPKQISLSQWFTEIDWLKVELPGSDYSDLGKPRILSESFIHVISTLLHEVTIIRKELIATINNIDSEIPLSKAAPDSNRRGIRERFLKELFKTVLVDKEFSDPKFKEFFLLDCVNDKSIRNRIRNVWNDSKIKNRDKLRDIYRINKVAFNCPSSLIPSPGNYPLEFEQNLFSFICSWLTIPPYNIFKLTRSNFLIVLDERSEPKLIKCTYFKGRSDRRYEPSPIPADSIIGKAIIAYLSSFCDEDKLFTISWTHTNNFTFAGSSTSKMLALMLESEYFGHKVTKELDKNAVSDIFKKAYLVLFNKHDLSHIGWINLNKKNKRLCNDVLVYRKEVRRWLPTDLFKLSCIKNSSIHSRSDKFRKGDPISLNSHTSHTEFESYLTDSNKEWVNLNGVVTRLVLEKVSDVYKFNASFHADRLINKLLKTEIKNIQSSDKNSNEHSLASTEMNKLLNMNVVLDTPETVLFMLHYIEQVTVKGRTLVFHNQDFFENTALPTAEWMETILATRISPKAMKVGRNRFEKLKSILPELFNDVIQAGDIS
jgi:hypothetical protein